MHAILAGLLLLEISAMPSDEVVAQYEDRTFTHVNAEADEEVYHYRLLKPAKIEPDTRYPIVLFLHGAGERGDDNKLQLLYLPEQMAQPEWREKYPCFLIAPQCRANKQWVEVPFNSKSSQMPEQPGDQMQVAIGILDEVLKEFPTDPRRVYLTGLSMGGYGSWDLGIRHPERFAAIVPICGGGDETQANRLVDVPVWAFHGAEDQAVPVERSRRMIEAIKQAGGKPDYTEFEKVGHNSWTPAYSDTDGVIPWMFKQVNERLKAE